MTTVAMQPADEITESLDQWVKFCSTLPNRARGGEVVDGPGVRIVCCRTLWPLGNSGIFTTPLESGTDLERRIGTVHGFFRDRKCNGMVFVADHLTARMRDQVPEVFARYGFVPVVTITGMAADALLPPLRPLPDLDYRPVSDAAAYRTLWELNAVAYEVPPEWGPDGCEQSQLGQPAFGLIGYRDGRPAACAVTVPIEGRLYMAFVATAHEFRRLGCAEAVMRRSLDDAARATGLRRMILHASPMGRPLYAQMGYHDTLPFTAYAQAH